MTQNALTILTPIDPAAVNDLDALLTQLGSDVAGQSLIPFESVEQLHFASWVILGGDAGPHQLLFEINFDGPPNPFLKLFVDLCKAGLEQIYASCPAYPHNNEKTKVVEYLLSCVVPTKTFYVGCVGLSRNQIRQEALLRARIESFLGKSPVSADPVRLRQEIQEFVQSQPDLRWALSLADHSQLDETRFRVLSVLAAVVFIGIIYGYFLLTRWVGLAFTILILLSAYLSLRWHEIREPSISDRPIEEVIPPTDHVKRLVLREDNWPQNHLASVTLVKPGVFRFFVLSTVLTVINLAARLIYNKGELAGIPSIHFARWTIINRGKNLVFLSNFDGSWEHYLGEFIDQAAKGLTAVWSNTVDFPRAKNLVQDGATDEQRFKSYARSSQLYTQLWYSAYPSLSVQNILNNAELRSGLWSPMTSKHEIESWLQRF